MAATKNVLLPAEVRRCPNCRSGRMTAVRAGLGGGWGGGWVQYLFVCNSCDHRMIIENASSRAMSGICGALLIAAAIGISIFIPAPAGFMFGFAVAAMGLLAIYGDILMPTWRCPVVDRHEDGMRPVEVEEALFASGAERARAERHQKIVRWGIYSVIAAMVMFFIYSFAVGGW